MSCFIMDPRATAVVADGIEKALNMGFNFLGFDTPETLREALQDCADRHGFFDKAKIFGKLYGLNYWAYKERYEGRHLDDVEETPEIPADVPALLEYVEYKNHHRVLRPEHYKYVKLLECLIYQCAEDGTGKTQLYKGLVDFRNVWFAFLVHNHDDWDAAPWGEV